MTNTLQPIALDSLAHVTGGAGDSWETVLGDVGNYVGGAGGAAVGSTLAGPWGAFGGGLAGSVGGAALGRAVGRSLDNPTPLTGNETTWTGAP